MSNYSTESNKNKGNGVYWKQIAVIITIVSIVISFVNYVTLPDKELREMNSALNTKILLIEQEIKTIKINDLTHIQKSILNNTEKIEKLNIKITEILFLLKQ